MRETLYLKENKNVLNLLRRIKTFKTFSDEDLTAFLEMGKLREYSPGEEIVRKGEKDYWAYFLISGEVKIVKGDKTLAVLQKSGELFGEMGVIDGSPRTATVWARTKTTVLGIDFSQLGTQPTGNKLPLYYTIFRLFSEVLAERLRVTTEEVVRLQDEVSMLKKKAGIKAASSEEDSIW